MIEQLLNYALALGIAQLGLVDELFLLYRFADDFLSSVSSGIDGYLAVVFALGQRDHRRRKRNGVKFFNDGIIFQYAELAWLIDDLNDILLGAAGDAVLFVVELDVYLPEWAGN